MRKLALRNISTVAAIISCGCGGPTAPESTPRYEGYVTSSDDGRPLKARVLYRSEPPDQPLGVPGELGPGLLQTWANTDESGYYRITTFYRCDNSRYYLIAVALDQKHENAEKLVECSTRRLQRVDIRLIPLPDSIAAMEP